MRTERRPPRKLFDLGFLELDVLASDGIVLAEAQLLRLRARVLLRDVEEAGIGSADELDLDGCWLGHRKGPNAKKGKAASKPPVRPALWSAEPDLSRLAALKWLR